MDANKQKIHKNKKAEWSAKVKKGKPRSSLKKALANKAVTTSKKIAFVNMVQVKPIMQEQCNSQQSPMDNPTLHTEPNCHNRFPIIHFGPSVVLDSGASDHMTGNLCLLTNIKEHFTLVLMPDGFIVDSHKKGTMRIAISANDKGTDFHAIPLLSTLLVPDLHSHLVSTLALNVSGILAKFDTTHTYLTLNGKDIVTNDPYHRRSQSQGVPFALNLESSSPVVSPTAKDTSKTKVPLELLHRRMGH